MVVAAGMLHIGLVVLVYGGVAKLRQQAPTVEALGQANLPSGRWLVLALGVGEVAVGSVGLVATVGFERPLSSLLPLALGASAALYLGFFWFLGRLADESPDAGCGCFGASSGASGAVHRWLTLGFAIVLGASAAASAVKDSDMSTAVNLLLESLATAVPYVALVAIGASLAIVVPSALTDLSVARRAQGAETVPTFALTGRARR